MGPFCSLFSLQTHLGKSFNELSLLPTRAFIPVVFMVTTLFTFHRFFSSSASSTPFFLAGLLCTSPCKVPVFPFGLSDCCFGFIARRSTKLRASPGLLITDIFPWLSLRFHPFHSVLYPCSRPNNINLCSIMLEYQHFLFFLVHPKICFFFL